MNVQIDAEAIEWLSKKQKNITLTSVVIQNCCVPINEIAIHYKDPDNPHRFKKVEMDQFTIFIDKTLQFKNDALTLSLSGFGPFKMLKVDGLVRF